MRYIKHLLKRRVVLECLEVGVDFGLLDAGWLSSGVGGL